MSDNDLGTTSFDYQVLDLDEARSITKYKPKKDRLTILDQVSEHTLYFQANHAITLAASTLGLSVDPISVNIKFVAPANANDTLIVEAKAIDIGGETSLWHAEVRKDSGELVALSESFARHRRDKSLAKQ